MKEQKLKTKDKKIQKMTRDGAVEEKIDTPKIKQENKARNLSKRKGRLRFTSEEAVPEKATSEKEKKNGTSKNQKQGKGKGDTKQSQKKATTKKRLYQEEKKKKVSKIRMEEVAYTTRKVVGKTQGSEEQKDDNVAAQGLQAGERATSKAYRLHKDRSALKSKQTYEKSPKLKEKKRDGFYGTGATKAGEVQKEGGKLQQFWQKQQIKRQYAKAKSAEKAGTSIAKRALVFFKEKGKKVVSFFAKPKFIITIVGLILTFALVAGGLTTCSMSSMQVVNTTILSSYIAEPEEIEKAELYYTELEAALQMRINQLETEYPGLDEYRYNIGEISHDPHVLIGYLTTKYEAFTFEQVKGEIEVLFEAQYGVDIETVTETREETRTAEGNANTVEVTTTETLEVLNVTMTAKPLRSVIFNRMNEEEQELYNLIYSTRGNLQIYEMPMDLNWYSYVKRPYGYSINASSGQRELHRGVEIALQEGTEIKAGKSGTIITVGNTSNYGNYVVLEDNKGYQLTYAHLSSVSVSRGQVVVAGETIGISGSTGSVSGGQLYLELVKNDVYYNPIFYVDAGDGGYGGSVHYDDETVQRLIREAEKYLGMPYVWGGSSPATSFDCSGFVCYVFTNSGVYNMGRTTAQGIYDLCDPIDSSEAKPGDLIFFTGTYNSVGAVSHIGIYTGNGQMIHCGDPIQYASIYSPYWQQHFYSFGRLR